MLELIITLFLSFIVLFVYDDAFISSMICVSIFFLFYFKCLFLPFLIVVNFPTLLCPMSSHRVSIFPLFPNIL